MMRRIPHADPEALAALPLAASAQLGTLQQALDEARREQQQRARLLPQVERALRALLGEELALHPDHIRAVVERELARVRRAAEIELQLHPDDAALLGGAAALQERLALSGALQVVQDPELTRGGCVLRSTFGQIDARLETRLQLALEQLERGVFDER